MNQAKPVDYQNVNPLDEQQQPTSQPYQGHAQEPAGLGSPVNFRAPLCAFVGPLSPYTIKLKMREMRNCMTANYLIHDEYNTPWLHVKNTGSFHVPQFLMLTAHTNQLVCQVAKKRYSPHGSWVIQTPAQQHPANRIMKMQPKSFSSKWGLCFAGSDKEQPRFQIIKSHPGWTSADFEVEDLELQRVVATFHKHGAFSSQRPSNLSHRKNEDFYSIEIAAGTDYTLMVAICVSIDGQLNELQRKQASH